MYKAPVRIAMRPKRSLLPALSDVDVARNRDVVEFVAWLREYNDALLAGSRKPLKDAVRMLSRL
jgi:erythromycin esterase-like protein